MALLDRGFSSRANHKDDLVFLSEEDRQLLEKFLIVQLDSNICRNDQIATVSFRLLL